MSWIEVETKIIVKDPKVMRKRIKAIARLKRTEKKTDDYYSLENKHYPKKSLRIRDKGTKREVNFKQRLSYKNGVWAKREVEFGVSDLNNFFSLLDDFGFRKWIRKEKKTELYKTKDGVSIELNHVKGLGWFVEIEHLCTEREIAKARKRIIEIMKHLGVTEKDAEKRGYTKQLADKRKRL